MRLLEVLENPRQPGHLPSITLLSRWRRPCASLVLLLAALVGACGGGGQPGVVSLASLRADPAAYSGKVVATEGLVQGSPVGPEGGCQYDITESDSSSNYVDVVPCSRFVAYVGRRVEVTGLFKFSPSHAAYDGGVVLEANQVVVRSG